MAIEVPQNEEISGGGKNGGRKGIGSAIHWGGANRGAYTLRSIRLWYRCGFPSRMDWVENINVSSIALWQLLTSFDLVLELRRSVIDKGKV